MTKQRSKVLAILIIFIVSASFLSSVMNGSSCSDTVFERVNGFAGGYLCSTDVSFIIGGSSSGEKHVLGGKMLIFLVLCACIPPGIYLFLEKLIGKK